MVVHVYSKVKRLADGLANYAFTLPLDFHMLLATPEVVCPIVLEDAQGMAIVRQMRM